MNNAADRHIGLMWRCFAVAIAVLALAVLAPLAVRINVARASAVAPNLLLAYGENPRDGINAGLLAWLLQRDGQRPLAVRLARAAIQETTLSAYAVGALAIAETSTSPQLAMAMLAHAQRLGWRDPIVQVRQARLALERSDYAAAARHADAAAIILGPNGEVRSLIDELALIPKACAALATRLTKPSVWRRDYLVESGAALESRVALSVALAGTAAPPTVQEIGAVIALALDHGGFVRAYPLWRSVARPQLAGYLADPDFRAAVDGSQVPFVWRLVQGAGFAANASDPGSANGLQVSSDGVSSSVVAMQVLRAPSGRHHFSVVGQFEPVSAASAFRWSASCWRDTQMTHTLDPIAGRLTGATGFDFAVPDDGTCPFQAITLSVQPADLPSAVQAQFRHARVD